ncbi:BMP family ABC transporter substrate-binding protein [Oleiphilus sp. HI0071]|nr:MULTISPECIES: BMP family ABC transporter substrate-binding protein [unclassified Oleiphilus]KZY72528.1 BMP family ABC transporter substrate-binding protein [Oleiphilus sp. HI0065]KZY82893.1 BMP family ABC transporter substrate-binding protein [Oleiphilus sp. HI0071]KZY90200.1 BMP family ABC transporter substrate-binding protein [Oleiphilus sp. HI0073]KZZ49199.1 BMP family ABC transporter substrate-binding protein [Oleiphilus sp. HI0122]KZZ75467.1 BMP family ABC transporter substrate-binding
MKLRSITKALAAATLVSGAALAQAEEPLNIGFVYVGPTGDAGWTYAHDEGRKYVEEQLGDKVKTTYVESVPEGADGERVIRQLASKGNDLIFTTSFGYMNPTLKVAKKFPKVAFEHASGYKRSDNMGTYFTRAYQGRYLTGLIAGKMTESNVLGYVASFPIPEVIRGINAFTKGAKEVNPDVQVKVVWASTWYDPAKEREAAETLILQGADVLTQHTDSAAVIQAAEAKGKYAIGYHSDMSEYGKKAHLTSTVHKWGPLYLKKAQAVLDGTWKSEDLWPGIADGTTDLAPLNEAIPADVVAMVEEKKAALKAGEMRVFDGPVVNQAGEEVIPAGGTMDDGALLGFDFYVQGVEGKLPQS